ncbi:MAG: hypothetical protein LQ337_002594 [Flavoplaca oasis]|nr:MAG: hypothetical protein LQ337_002594 [Flavoplaca oasis]
MAPSKQSQTTDNKGNVSTPSPNFRQVTQSSLNSIGEDLVAHDSNRRLTVGTADAGAHTPNQLPEAAQIQAESITQLEEIRSRTVSIRLPCQLLQPFPIKMTNPSRQPQHLLASKPTPYKNPNRVILRLPPSPKPKPTSFLSLAQEIRNQIYEHAMPRHKYRVQWIPRNDQRPTELTYTLPLDDFKGPNLTAKAGKLRRGFDLPKRAFVDEDMPRYRLSPGPAALLLVSRQVYQETAPMFYGRNTFSFVAMRPLGKFLSSLGPGTRSMIRSLELIHFTASNAQLLRDQTWKRKHDQCWENLCLRIRNQCDRLENLTIDLYIKDLPFKLGPHASWMSPLYAFMGLENLRHVDIRLHQVETDDAVLEVEAYTVRKALMGDNFYEPLHNTGNKPILEKRSPCQARPGVNARRVTVGNRRVPASCIRPSLGPGATVFWSPPTPRTREEISITENRCHPRGMGRVASKQSLLVWTPPTSLLI